jgi:hypothetical protein
MGTWFGQSAIQAFVVAWIMLLRPRAMPAADPGWHRPASGIRMGPSTYTVTEVLPMGDKGPGSKSGAKKPKGGTKAGDKKKKH